MTYTQIKSIYDDLTRQLQTLNTLICALPDGELFCAKNGNYYKWYLKKDSDRSYISKGSRSLAEALAMKKYYTLLATELSEKICILRSCLDALKHTTNKSSALLEMPEYHELLNHQRFSQHLSQQSADSFLFQWLSEKYEQNHCHPEVLIHATLSGNRVRSKSEVIIANALFTNQIPFRYECKTQLGDIVLYPDFTILHPKSFQIFYWEHFGLMDQAAYCENVFHKLKTYSMHHIIPSINLITTYETSAHPLDSGNVADIIQAYFLTV